MKNDKPMILSENFNCTPNFLSQNTDNMPYDYSRDRPYQIYRSGDHTYRNEIAVWSIALGFLAW